MTCLTAKPAVGAVTLHVAGRTRNQRFAGEFERLLRATGKRVDLGHDRDLGPAGTPLGPQIGRHSGAAEVDPETRGLERALEQLGALELLHAGFAEIEQRIADRRHLVGVAIDHVESELLALVGGLTLGRLADQQNNKTQRRQKSDQAGTDCAPHGCFPRAAATNRMPTACPNGIPPPQSRQALPDLV
jgi:hypothetical protein